MPCCSEAVSVGNTGFPCWKGLLPSLGGLRRLVGNCVLRGQGSFRSRIGVLTDKSRDFYRLPSLFFSRLLLF